MSESKEDSNSTPSDVKEEEKSPKGEETKNLDESSKDSAKEDSAKKESEKEDSVKDESVKEDSDKEDSDEDEEGMGLLDRPVEVTGCRARKKVERLELSFGAPASKVLEIPEGEGDKLGDCPIIEFHIQRSLINDLKPLHKILFNKAGYGNEVKKHIRKFSGFTFAKDSPEMEKKKTSLEKLTIGVLKNVCLVLDLERSGTKDDIMTRIVEFLLKPKNSGKVPKKKSSSKDKRKKSEKTKNSKKATAKKETLSSELEYSVNESDSEGRDNKDDKHDSGSDLEKSKEETKKKLKNTPKAKKTPSKPAKKAEKKEKNKKEEKKEKNKKEEKKEKNKKEEKKTLAKGIKRKRDDEDDDSFDSSDDEPIAKHTKMPSDDEIKKLVKRILDAADLQEITMKKVIKQVADAYPQCDMSHKKAFIKATIKSVIS